MILYLKLRGIIMKKDDKKTTASRGAISIAAGNLKFYFSRKITLADKISVFKGNYMDEPESFMKNTPGI